VLYGFVSQFDLVSVFALYYKSGFFVSLRLSFFYSGVESHCKGGNKICELESLSVFFSHIFGGVKSLSLVLYLEILKFLEGSIF